MDGTGPGVHAWANHCGQESRGQGLARLESRAGWSLESGVSPSQATGLSVGGASLKEDRGWHPEAATTVYGRHKSSAGSSLGTSRGLGFFPHAVDAP